MLKYVQTALGLVQMSFPTTQYVSLHLDIGFDGCICWFLSLVSDIVFLVAVLGVNIADFFFSGCSSIQYEVGETICPQTHNDCRDSSHTLLCVELLFVVLSWPSLYDALVLRAMGNVSLHPKRDEWF